MKKVGLCLIALLAAIFLLTPVLSAGEPKYGGTFRFGLEDDLKVLDPHVGSLAIEGYVLHLVFEPLIASDSNYLPQPQLAESYEVSPDGKVWTFRLRKGVKIHTGRELTSEDIKFSYDRIMDEKTAAGLRTQFSVVESFEIVDRYTFNFVLKEPSGGFIARFYNPFFLPFMVVPPESVDADGKITHPVGTGPFEFVEWKQNDYIKFKKFKDYRIDGLPYFDEVVVLPIPDQTTRMTALKTGDIDASRLLPLDQVADLIEKPAGDTNFALRPGGVSWFLTFNLSQPPFDDVRVRQAVAYGLNKQEISDGVTFGLGEVVNQDFPNNSPWHFDVPELYERNVEKAKALLAEAGYPDGLEAKILTTTGYPETVDMAVVVQAQLKEIGVNIELTKVDTATFIGKLQKGDFEIGSFGWVANADPENFYPLLFKTGAAYGFVFQGYGNPKVDDLLNKGGAAIKYEDRKAYYTEALRLMLEDSPAIFTFISPLGVGWKSYVKDFDLAVNVFCYYGGGFQYGWLDK